MKNTTKRIIVSVLTLVLTIAAVGTTTFAWFSLSNVANISNIGGQVQAGEGLEVRIASTKHKDGKFRTNLSEADWNDFLTAEGMIGNDNESDNFKFGAVTISKEGTIKMIEQDKTTGQYKYAEKASKNKHYLEFDLEFRSLSEGKINLNKLGFDGSKEVDWTFNVDEYNQIDEENKTVHNIKTSAANAARVAFINDTGVVKVVYQQDEGAGIPDGVTDISNGYYVDANTIYGNNASTTVESRFGQYSFLTQAMGVEFATGSLPTEAKIYEAVQIKTIAEQDLGVELTTTLGETHYTGKITVRIWVEGWDADAYDTIFLAPLFVNFVFEKVEIL